MHVNDALRAAAFVQVVDVLRHDQDLARVVLLEPRECDVCCVGLHVGEFGAARVVEVVHQNRVSREPFGRGHILHVVLRPHAARIAKGGDPGIGGNAGPGQNNDAAV